jgi:hypothetical protein
LFYGKPETSILIIQLTIGFKSLKIQKVHIRCTGNVLLKNQNILFFPRRQYLPVFHIATDFNLHHKLAQKHNKSLSFSCIVHNKGFPNMSENTFFIQSCQIFIM